MRMRRAIIVPLVAGVLASCNDRRTPTTPTSAPTGPQFAISDAANNNGNPNFFFLPPLVTNPNQNANWRSGSFNAHLLPVVRVFQQAPTTTGCDASAPLAFGPAPMVLDTSSEQYQFNWDTKASSLTPGTNYRVCVYGSPAPPDKGGAWLGFVDVQPVSGGMKKVATNEIYAFQDDRTLPIKVRIQQGALSTTSGTGCVDPASCTEAVVVGAAKGTPGDTPVTIVVPSGHEALTVPAGAVNPGDVVTIVMQQQTPPDTVNGTPVCLPTTLRQTLGCYHISSQPDLYQFQSNVAVEVCVEFPGDFPVADTAKLQLYKFNQTQGLQALPRVEATHVNCSGFTALSYRASARPTNLAARALERVGRWVGRLLAPPPLYAYWFGLPPKGIGGGGGSLSDFGGAVSSLLPPGVPTSLGAGAYSASAHFWGIFRLDTGATAWVVVDTGLVYGHPSWSPDGTKLAFEGDSGPSQIFTVNRDGSGLTRLTSETYLPAQGPAWSPLNDQIAFSQWQVNGNRHIVVMNTSGSNTIDLTPIRVDQSNTVSDGLSYGSGTLYGQTFQPTGDTLVQVDLRFTANNLTAPATTIVGIYRDITLPPIAAETVTVAPPLSDLRPVISYRFRYPIPIDPNVTYTIGWYSPQGSNLAWELSQQDPYPRGQAVGADGTPINPPTDFVFTTYVTNLTDNFHPAWSPNGTQIAFTSDRDSSYQIYVMNADGTNQRRVTQGPGSALDPSWAPDGSRIAYVCVASAQYDICTMDPAGGNVTKVTNDATVDYYPAWSPDGNWIAFERYLTPGVNFSDIFLIKPDGSGMKRVTDGTMDFRGPTWPVPYRP